MIESIAYKVLTTAELAALEAGVFNGSAVDKADGYIHLSTAAQLDETVSKHFAGQCELQIVAIDLDVLAGAVKWEVARGDGLFPHLHGPLPLDAVLAYGPLERREDGGIRLPVAG